MEAECGAIPCNNFAGTELSRTYGNEDGNFSNYGIISYYSEISCYGNFCGKRVDTYLSGC